MANEITNFEIWLKKQLLSLPEVVECVSDRIFNSVAGQKSPFPRIVFTVIPLEDKTGQARTSIQTNLLVDIKITSRLPLDAKVEIAREAIREHFRLLRNQTENDTVISIRHERPISLIEPGTVANEKLITRGGSFRVWLTKQ